VEALKKYLEKPNRYCSLAEEAWRCIFVVDDAKQFIKQ